MVERKIDILVVLIVVISLVFFGVIWDGGQLFGVREEGKMKDESGDQRLNLNISSEETGDRVNLSLEHLNVAPLNLTSSKGSFILLNDSLIYNRETRPHSSDIFRYYFRNSSVQEVVSRGESIRVKDMDKDGDWIVYTANTYYGSNVGVYNLREDHGRILAEEKHQKVYSFNQTYPSVWRDRVVYLVSKINEETGEKVRLIRLYALSSNRTQTVSKLDVNATLLDVDIARGKVIWGTIYGSRGNWTLRAYSYDLSTNETRTINVSSSSPPLYIIDNRLIFMDGQRIKYRNLETGRGWISDRAYDGVRFSEFDFWNSTLVAGGDTRNGSFIWKWNIHTGRTKNISLGKYVSPQNVETRSGEMFFRTSRGRLYHYQWY